jgi:hypothetical protein
VEEQGREPTFYGLGAGFRKMQAPLPDCSTLSYMIYFFSVLVLCTQVNMVFVMLL